MLQYHGVLNGVMLCIMRRVYFATCQTFQSKEAARNQCLDILDHFSLPCQEQIFRDILGLPVGNQFTRFRIPFREPSFRYLGSGT